MHRNYLTNQKPATARILWSITKSYGEAHKNKSCPTKFVFKSNQRFVCKCVETAWSIKWPGIGGNSAEHNDQKLIRAGEHHNVSLKCKINPFSGLSANVKENAWKIRGQEMLWIQWSVKICQAGEVPWWFGSPNFSSIWSALCKCLNQSDIRKLWEFGSEVYHNECIYWFLEQTPEQNWKNQKPRNGGNLPKCDQKFIRPGEYHDICIHNDWDHSPEWLGWKCAETTKVCRIVEWMNADMDKQQARRVKPNSIVPSTPLVGD